MRTVSIALADEKRESEEE